MKLSILMSVLLWGTMVYAGGAINFYEEGYVDIPSETIQSMDEEYFEPVEIVEEASIEEESEDSIYAEYKEPIIEEYNREISSKDSITGVANSISNGLNAYGVSQHTILSNNKEISTIKNGLVEENTTNRSITDTSIALLNNSNRFYASLGISAVHYTIPCNCPSKSRTNSSFKGVITKAGYKINKFIDIEARGMKLNLKDKGKISHVGVFLKPKVPLTPNANIYTLVGVAKTKSSGKMKEINAETLALGTGVEIAIGESFSTFVDYERLIMKSNAPKFDTISTGMTYGF